MFQTVKHKITLDEKLSGQVDRLLGILEKFVDVLGGLGSFFKIRK